MRFLIGKGIRSLGWKLFVGYEYEPDFYRTHNQGWHRFHIGLLKVVRMPAPGGLFEAKLHYRGLWLRIDVFFPIVVRW